MSIKKMSYIIFSITFLVILTSILSLPFIFDSYKKAQAFEELLKNTSIALENTSSALNEYLVFSMPRAKTQLALAAKYENHSLNKLEKFSSDYPLITTLVKKHKDFQKNLDILFNIMNSGKNHIISEKNKKLVVKEIGSQLFLLSSERSGYVMELSFLAKKNFMFKSNILIGSIFICIFILSGLLGLIVLWLQKRLVSPLVTLRDSVESIAQGNFTIKPTIQRNDEIGSLADSFSVMQKSIQKNIIKITEAREDLHITLNSIGDGVISTDMQGRVARMNPVAEKLTGWTYKKAKGKQVSNVFNIIHTQTGELADNPVEKVLATGKVVGLANHTALIAKNGSKYQIADSGAPIRNTKGNITGVVLVFRNVTKEYQLREQYITLFEKTNDAIFIVEKSTGRYLDANAAAAQLTGRTLKELKQLTTHDVAPESSDKRFFDIADSDKTREYGTITYCQPDNTRRIARLSTVPLNDNAVIDIAKDITHDLEVEKQLLQSQKMEAIGTLAGGIAHDFNNILFPIMGHTEMLLQDISKDSPFRNGLNHIYTGATRASNLVKQILTFSRQENNDLKLIRIQPIIKEALELIRSTIPTTIEINQDLNPNCGIIKADPTQIHQIVMNLATNAYHAMEKTGGKLKVTLKEVELGQHDVITPEMTLGNYACLSVSDTGIGIDKNLTKKIFDPFFTTKKKDKGTGMGLSVIHGIVKNMKGAVKIYSESGKGTQLYVYLPVVSSSFEKLENQHIEDPIQGGDERILLVDDEEEIIIMEKMMLERLGYKVTSHTSSIEALEVFSVNPNKFDLVITDMAMPNMPGDKLAIELTKICSDIPILLCSGFSETISEEKEAPLGIKGFLLKPIVMKDLDQKIREILS